MVLFLFLANSLTKLSYRYVQFLLKEKVSSCSRGHQFFKTYDPLLVGSSWNLKSEKKQHKRKYPTMKSVQQISQKKRYLGILLISLYILTNDINIYSNLSRYFYSNRTFREFYCRDFVKTRTQFNLRQLV